MIYNLIAKEKLSDCYMKIKLYVVYNVIYHII